MVVVECGLPSAVVFYFSYCGWVLFTNNQLVAVTVAIYVPFSLASSLLSTLPATSTADALFGIPRLRICCRRT